MKVTVNKEANCRRIIDIEVPQEDVASEFKRLVFEYRAEATVPGFRKGKAPIDVVKKRYYDSIKADALENLIQKAYNDTLVQEKINPVDQPKLSDVKYSENEPLIFKAEVEVFPEFEVQDYKGLKLEKKVRETTDQDVEAALKQIQRANAEYHPVQRPCHDNDLVIVDLIKKIDKLGKLGDDKMENIEVDLGGDGVLKEFKDGLRGMNIGEMKDIEVKYPDNYSDKQLAGNEVKYTAIVKEVKEIHLPEFNDEFAKNFGKYESFDKLKAEIRDTLKSQAEGEAEDSLKGSLIKQIVDKNHFDIPESMVNNYLNSVTEDFKKRYKDVDELKLRQGYRSLGEATIRWQFIFHSIAEMEKLAVSEQERGQWVKDFAARYNISETTAREALGKAGKFQDIDDNLLEKKVLDFVMKNSEISS